ncbi:OLC1v1007539C1 [Oldenlandia corymbosa var. corymbosa]|nr:OLC1v1007539C1 [Oldenlandia corymbosa var. corymbosa]
MMIMSQGNTNDIETGEHHRNQRRLCVFCGEATAVLYCRADSAKLCLACDRQVHSTNQLFTKHTRWLLCDSCDSTPATIFCRTHAAVLCQNCDWDHHNNNSTGQHDRRPLEGFSGCPSASELLGILGFDSDVAGKKGAAPVGKVMSDVNNNIERDDGENVYGFSDFLVWETPSVVSLDDLIVPPQRGGDDDCSSGGAGGGHAFQAMGVPPLPKNRNATCGQHKEEILLQIREISKLEPNLNGEQVEFESFGGFQFLEADQQDYQSKKQGEYLDNVEQPTLACFDKVPSVEWFSDKVDVGNQDFPAVFFGSYIETNNAVVPDKVSEAGDSSGHMNDSHEDNVHGIGTDTGNGTGSFQILPRFSVRELNSQERDSAISRYKEKKKTRR